MDGIDKLLLCKSVKKMLRLPLLLCYLQLVFLKTSLAKFLEKKFPSRTVHPEASFLYEHPLHAAQFLERIKNSFEL